MMRVMSGLHYDLVESRHIDGLVTYQLPAKSELRFK